MAEGRVDYSVSPYESSGLIGVKRNTYFGRSWSRVRDRNLGAHLLWKIAVAKLDLARTIVDNSI